MSAIARLGTLLGVWVVAWLPLAIPLARWLKWRPGQPFTPQQKLPLMLSLYGVAIPVLWGLSRFWGITFRQYGWQAHPSFWLQVALGFGVATGSLGLFYGVQVLLGWLGGRSPQQPRDWLLVLPLLLLALWVSVTEELLFRGFLQQQLLTVFSPLGAIALGSLIFALLHFVWEPWRQEWPQLPGLWLLGVVLCLARLAGGGSLALAIGLHAGWVWVIACSDSLGLWQPQHPQGGWLTGEPGKPLASGLGLLMLLIVGGGLWQFR